MGVPRLAGYHHKGDRTPHTFIDEPVVDRPKGEEHRNRGPGGLRLSVGEHEDRGSQLDGLGRLLADLVETRLIPSGPSPTAQVVAIQWEKKRRSPERTIASSSASERIGLANSMRWACCGVSSSSGPRFPAGCGGT